MTNKVNLNPNTPTIPLFGSGAPCRAKQHFQPQEAEKWVKSHPQKYQQALRALLKTIRRISFKQFQVELDKSFKSILENIPITTDWGKKNVVILTEPQKSNKWIADLVASSTKKLFPVTQYHRLGAANASSFSKFLDGLTKEKRAQFKGKTFVLFDDGSYSGTQITNHVTQLFKALNKKGLTQTKVSVVIPYMTPYAAERLQREVEDLGCKKRLMLSSYHTIPTVATSLSPKKLQLINELFWGEEEKKGESRGIYWFDHKVPNGMSFPEALAKGTVPGKNKTFSFIPKIQVPYRDKN